MIRQMNPDYQLILDYLSLLTFNPVFQEILECFTRPSLLEFTYPFPENQIVTLQVPIPVIEGVMTPNGSRVKNGMVIYETRWRNSFASESPQHKINYILKFSFDPRGWILSCMIDDGRVAVSEYAEVYSREQGLVSLKRVPLTNLKTSRPISFSIL